MHARSVGFLALLAAVVAACSGGSGDEATPAATTAPASAAVGTPASTAAATHATVTASPAPARLSATAAAADAEFEKPPADPTPVETEDTASTGTVPSTVVAVPPTPSSSSTPTVEPPPEPPPPTPVPTPVDDAVSIVAVGDIACPPELGVASWRCQHAATSELTLALEPSAVLILGDAQYYSGELANFELAYEPTWGRLKSVTRPAPGNHEYHTEDAAGYFGYFGAAAGDAARGYYSFDLGDWHIVALNTECHQVGGCFAGSAQEQWLRADLAASDSLYTLVFGHHPRFSSGIHGDADRMKAMWRAMHEAGVELYLAAHDHHYERFAALNADGVPDPEGGVRQFVAGTGGRSLRTPPGTRAGSEVMSATFGVLQLTLQADSYNWAFAPMPGSSFSDSGSGTCHNRA